MITGSRELIRDINSHLVLESIVNSGPISRADLAKYLGLTKATISAIVQILLDEYLIVEIGSRATEKGRKPILLDFNQHGGHTLCLDIGIDCITVLTSDLRGANCRLHQYPNKTASKDIISILKGILSDTIAKLPVTPHKVVGISIGIHGVVHDNQVMFAPYYDLENIPLAKELFEEFQIPVFVENEANFSVLGERTFYFSYPSIINLSVHAGIGMGILIDNQLYSGSNGYAGEFGHSIMIPDGRPCPCGNQGCFEQYASERALLLELQERKQDPSLTIDNLVALYRKGDKDAANIIEQFVKYMSIGINNLLNTFNPDIIVLNSSISIYIPDIIPMIRDSLKNRMNKYCTILPSGLQDTAILLGGASVVIKNFLGIDKLILISD